MEDNDKRNSSRPSASSVSSEEGSGQASGPRRSEPDLFDSHEPTLPRFTIDPSEAVPRQRTRTLLGVPTLVQGQQGQQGQQDKQEDKQDKNEEELRLPVPPTAVTVAEADEVEPQTTKLSTAILDTHEVPATLQEPGNQAIIDITVDVDVDDDMNDVTMVSDADVVALPDNTGQMQPVSIEAPAVLAAGASQNKPETQKDEPSTSAEPAYAATAPQPSSLSPREIARPASQPPRDTSGRAGALLVAAVMLLATGAWFLTAGTFRRATLSTPAESTTAAATQPTNAMAEPKIEQPAPAEKPTPTSAEAVSAAPSTPTTPAPLPKQAPSSEDGAAPALKQKPALTASARGERVRRSARASKATATPAPVGDLPQGPTRTEVVARLESVRSSVQACAAGRSGVADLDITIAHTGVVMHVLVGGDFAGTTEGSCIARAVRQARFPQFKQERFRLLYPYAM